MVGATGRALRRETPPCAGTNRCQPGPMLELPMTTCRTRLRPVTDDDVTAVHRVLGDPETTAEVSFGQASPEATAAWIQRRAENQRTHGISMWAVELPRDQRDCRAVRVLSAR